MRISLFVVAVLLCGFSNSKAKLTSNKIKPCGSSDWQAFEDKCFRILPNKNRSKGQSLTSGQAADICRKVDPMAVLPTVESYKEHSYISDLLLSNGSIWMGGKLSHGNLIWGDGAPTNYTNWSEFIRIPSDGTFCVLMDHGGAHGPGNWTIHKCNKSYAVSIVCQKPQVRILYKMKTTLQAHIRKSVESLHQNELKLRENQERLQRHDQEKKRLRAELDAHTNTSLKLKMDILKKSIVIPIGFIYIQYKDQAEPKSIWPKFNWTEVSSYFAGEFFRVVGGTSHPFGETQTANNPGITTVQYQTTGSAPVTTALYYLLCQTFDSTLIRTGQRPTSDQVGLSFTASGGEARPINSAVRVWKRSA